MKALIIGAGIGGLAAAIGLRRAGAEIQVFERAEPFGEVGAGITLWPNAVKALQQLGLAEAIRAISVLEARGGIRTWRGALLSSASTADIERAFGAPTLVMHRPSCTTCCFKRSAPNAYNSARSMWVSRRTIIPSKRSSRMAAACMAIC